MKEVAWPPTSERVPSRVIKTLCPGAPGVKGAGFFVSEANGTCPASGPQSTLGLACWEICALSLSKMELLGLKGSLPLVQYPSSG